jgi:hypothetical protein
MYGVARDRGFAIVSKWDLHTKLSFHFGSKLLECSQSPSHRKSYGAIISALLRIYKKVHILGIRADVIVQLLSGCALEQGLCVKKELACSQQCDPRGFCMAYETDR